MYADTEDWEASCPASLGPAVRALRSRFADAHWKVGSITEQLVYSLLREEVTDGVQKNLPYLLQFKQIAGPLATHRFNEMVGVKSSSAIFRAFLNLYEDILSVEIVIIFKHLLEIGAANANDLSVNHRDWAKQQSSNLIRSEAYMISIWVRRCCDHDDSLDIDTSKWMSWQAPKLLTMTPARQLPYVAEAVWNRLDAEFSQRLLKHFEQYYVLRLERALGRAWETATVEAAKQSPTTQTTSAAVLKPSGEVAASVVRSIHKEKTRLNGRQLLSLKKHQAWKREYQKMKRQRPGKSDVWYSQQIAKLAISEGAGSETVRKNMK